MREYNKIDYYFEIDDKRVIPRRDRIKCQYKEFIKEYGICIVICVVVSVSCIVAGIIMTGCDVDYFHDKSKMSVVVDDSIPVFFTYRYFVDGEYVGDGYAPKGMYPDVDGDSIDELVTSNILADGAKRVLVHKDLGDEIRVGRLQ